MDAVSSLAVPPLAVPRQLALPFQHRPTYAPLDFMADTSNQEALSWLENTASWPERRLALWGEEGCGKSHLLHVWADECRALVVSGPSWRAVPPELPAGGVAIDDADMPADERAMLHLLNTARDTGVPVLVTGRARPSAWGIVLPDLASRLRAIAAVRVGPPERALLAALLSRLLSDRQLAMPDRVRDWLLLNLPGTPAALRDAVARLDRAALASARRISLPMARETLCIRDFDDIMASSPAATFRGDSLL